ncbi:MAG: polyprenyl synthetase family protein [Oscillospiraceae bacterium]
MSDYEELLAKYVAATQRALDGLLENSKLHSTVVEAMRYSILGVGKRVRAQLVLGTCEALCGEMNNSALMAACAIEMLHCYSLIHDDLPCMDNDDMRRGKPSCHKRYNEYTALLAGDALLTEAFGTLSKIENAEISRSCAATLAEYSGYCGMIRGQELDLQSEGTKIDAKQLALIHDNKTGALIKASGIMGAICANAGKEDLRHVEKYCSNVGMVFQIVDDILDCTSTTGELGKPVGSDAQNDKTTFASLYGVEQSREIADRLTREAVEEIGNIEGNPSFLQALARALLIRLK